MVGCSVVTIQLPSNLVWIQQLIAKTSLNFTLFTAANAFAGLFSTVQAILEPGTADDNDDNNDDNDNADSS